MSVSLENIESFSSFRDGSLQGRVFFMVKPLHCRNFSRRGLNFVDFLFESSGEEFFICLYDICGIFVVISGVRDEYKSFGVLKITEFFGFVEICI